MKKDEKLMINVKKLLTNLKIYIIFKLTININFLMKGRVDMKTDIISKVNKIGKAGVIITKIGKVFLWIACIVCLLTGLLLLALPDDFIVIHMEGKAAIEVSFPTAISQADFYVIEEDGVAELKWNEVTWGEVDSSLEVNGQEYGIVGMVKTENGYLMDAQSESYTIRIRNFAYIVLLSAVLCAVALVTMHFVGNLCRLFQDCETPFTLEISEALKKLAIAIIPMAFFTNLSESVTNSVMSGDVNIVIGVDVMTVLLVLLVFMLSAIFNYGTMLQQESDETL